MKDLTNRLAYQGMRIEDYAHYIGTTLEKLREERRDDAIRIAKTRQILEAIIRAEDITVSDAEIDEQIAEIAKMSNKTLQEYKKSMDSRRLDYIYSDILMAKLMKMLVANNTVIPTKDGEGAKKSTAKKSTKATEKAETKVPAKATKKVAEKKENATKKPTKAEPKKAAAKTETKKPATKTATKATAAKTTTKKPAAKTATKATAEKKTATTAKKATTKKTTK